MLDLRYTTYSKTYNNWTLPIWNIMKKTKIPDWLHVILGPQIEKTNKIIQFKKKKNL